MFGVLLRVLPFIVPAVRVAEKIFGKGQGAAKKQTVLDLVLEEVQNELAPYGVSLDSPDAAKFVGMITDGIVGLFNLVGIFKHSGAAAALPPATSATP